MFLASFTILANGSFPELRLQMISPSVHVYDSPRHDPIVTCVIPAGLPYLKMTMGSGKSHGHSSNKDQTPAEKRTSRDVETTQESAQQVPPCFPPDEPPVLTKILSNGQVRSFAGTVTLVHVPSLPLRKPSRFPLDDPMLKAPTERIGDTKPQLHGLGTIHPGLIERNNSPPITGWAVDVPLDDDDMKYESRPTSRVGDTMQIDDAVVNTRSSNDKEDSEELIKVRLQTAALGMDGKVIVVVGTRGRIWVYRMKSGHKTY